MFSLNFTAALDEVPTGVFLFSLYSVVYDKQSSIKFFITTSHGEHAQDFQHMNSI